MVLRNIKKQGLLIVAECENAKGEQTTMKVDAITKKVIEKDKLPNWYGMCHAIDWLEEIVQKNEDTYPQEVEVIWY